MAYKLTPEKVAIIREAAAQGMSMTGAAAMLAVHQTTMHRWFRAGRRERQRRDSGGDPDHAKDLHVQMYIAWSEGVAALERLALEAIKQAATSGIWQAAAWLLERRLPDDWGSNAAEIKRLLKEIRHQRLRGNKGDNSSGKGEGESELDGQA